MKIRNGFVSNSSSSSFVVIATKEKINEALNLVTEKYRKFIRSTFVSGRSKFTWNGIEYLKKFDTYYTDNLFEYFKEDVSEEEMWEQIRIFFDALGEPSEIHEY